jgi:hypothetical protein
VVGVTGKNLLCPIELFEKHAANQRMRPSHRAERHRGRCPVEDGGVEPFGSADGEGEFGRAHVAPAGEVVGENPARPHVAARVEGDEAGSGRACGEDQFGFARLQRRRGQALPHLEFDDYGRGEEPVGVERRQRRGRPRAQFADGEKAETDRRNLRTGT